MSTAIFDRNGTPVGWTDGDVIWDLSGQHRAFIGNGNVYTYSAAHLGTFKEGYFRDKFGDAVAFIEGAKNGPLTPLPALPPIAPLFPLAPLPPFPPLYPLPPLPSLSWSNIDWEGFLQEEF